MTDSQSEGEADDGLEDVYQSAPEHTLTPDKSFQAWHHPRKHFVRIKQWCAEVQKLIPQLGLGQGDSFRYLTLPGNELLDVRALHGVVARAKVKLRYLGFNSVGANTPEQAELALSQSEVRSLAWIDEFSGVIEERLEAVANDGSQAASRTRQAGPFHAINLDLCDSIAFREIGHARGSPLEAVGKLLELQLQSPTPWLLFVTTKAEPGLLGEFAKEGFGRAIASNAQASAEFREQLAQLITCDIDRLDAELQAAWGNQDARFLRLFCTGLGKWLLSIMSNAAPPRELTLLSSCYYQSGPDGPDMLSLAFRCGAPEFIVTDLFDILPTAGATPPISEIESALGLAANIGELFDLDAHLSADTELQEKLIGQAGNLLATARYEKSAYETWARARLA